MVSLVFFIALGLLVVSGLSIALLIAPPKSTYRITELIGLSILLGAAFVSLCSWILAVLAPAVSTRWPVTCIIVLALIGALVRCNLCGVQVHLPDLGLNSIFQLSFFAIIVALLAYIVARHGLAWDGVFVWEFKAHAACLSNGTLPLSLFSDPTRGWTHPDYPLLIPLDEAWIYSWLGRCDQTAAQHLFPAFLIAAICLLYSAAARLGGHTICGYVAAAMPFFVPRLLFGEGSVSSGYADLPEAAFYLAAVAQLCKTPGMSRRSDALMLGILAGLLPWVKQEGMVLWVVVMVLGLRMLMVSPDVKVAMGIVAPGFVFLACWKVFLALVGAPPGSDFLPITVSTALHNIDRLASILPWLLKELSDWTWWGFLWPLFALAIVMPGGGSNRKQKLIVATSVVVPILAEAASYVFSAWNPYMNHVQFSLPRLILQTSLVAILLVASLLPYLPDHLLRSSLTDHRLAKSMRR